MLDQTANPERELLDSSIYRVGEDEANPLASLIDTSVTLVEHYDDEHVPMPRYDCAPASTGTTHSA